MLACTTRGGQAPKPAPAPAQKPITPQPRQSPKFTDSYDQWQDRVVRDILNVTLDVSPFLFPCHPCQAPRVDRGIRVKVETAQASNWSTVYLKDVAQELDEEEPCTFIRMFLRRVRDTDSRRTARNGSPFAPAPAPHRPRRSPPPRPPVALAFQHERRRLRNGNRPRLAPRQRNRVRVPRRVLEKGEGRAVQSRREKGDEVSYLRALMADIY